MENQKCKAPTKQGQCSDIAITNLFCQKHKFLEKRKDLISVNFVNLKRCSSCKTVKSWLEERKDCPSCKKRRIDKRANATPKPRCNAYIKKDNGVKQCGNPASTGKQYCNKHVKYEKFTDDELNSIPYCSGCGNKFKDDKIDPFTNEKYKTCIKCQASNK